MNNQKKKLCAKVAYLYYVENKTQAEIATILGIYRTTISRILTQAKKEGLVKIEIVDCDVELLALEEYFRKKYDLDQVELVATTATDSENEKNEALAQSAANFVKNLVSNNQVIGISWGSTLSKMIEKLAHRHLENTLFCPLAGGPSHIHSNYHVNTLVYEMARKFHGKSAFVNATVIQESAELAQETLQSKAFEEILDHWQHLDVAIVGVGGALNESNSQWRDLLSKKDSHVLEKEQAVGECICRFFNQEGAPLHHQLQKRTIGIPLEKIAQVPTSVAIARGIQKAPALLAMTRKKYVHSIVSDQETVLEMLRLDQDTSFQ